METTDIIAITGAAGFIGSYLTGYLNRHGYKELILVDDFSREDKALNLTGKTYQQKVHRDIFFTWLNDNKVNYIFHLGARTDTTEMNYEVFKKLNLDYSINIWKHCVSNNIPLVYASSAATYGNGEYGYTDSHDIVSKLQPLNPYGLSKNQFDQWALHQTTTPPFWAGLKFFNVYGPNEYHKSRMASVIFHAFHQVKNTGKVKLFRSHNPEYKDGQQMRDFIYVEDIANICFWLMQHQPQNGLYNAGTGIARSFNDLAAAVFNAAGVPTNIEYVDTPADIRNTYQYFTEANMQKLRNSGFPTRFHTLEEGINSYVNTFLEKGSYF